MASKRIPTCRFQSRWARIISGADEGVYGWIALNYMTGHLASNPILAADQGLEGTADEPIAVTSAPSLTPAVSSRILCRDPHPHPASACHGPDADLGRHCLLPATVPTVWHE